MPPTAKILTIDDEPILRDIIVSYLEDSNFQVIEAANGQEGIELCRREQPDLVLCDLRMPGMDGLQVLGSLTEEFPETPVIVISGMGRISDAVDALKRGAWDYITKPIEDMAALEHSVQQCLERARLRRENRAYRENLEAVNAQLQQSLRRLQQDEEAGRQIQFQLLPENRQRHGPYEFSRQLLTSLYLSGDFVDYFAIDNVHLGFYIADVAGHGVSSAFVTVLLRSYMNRYLERYRQDQDTGILQPAKILRRLNQEILQGRLGKYLTMFYGVIDSAANRLHYSNGGQFPFPLLFDGDHTAYLESKSLPVGLFSFADYQPHTLDLPDRFALALISDGILETLPQSHLKGKLDFLLTLVDSIDTSVESLARQLNLDQTSTLPDDITILLITRRN
ncbi:MAG: SpoIIE family protein phosphatase [Candidatus Competibacteraceae bacterium]